MPELYHYGIKGQRWNDRRYQYEDGSLTPEGKIRYGVGQGRRHSYGNYRPGNRSYSKRKPTNNNNKVSKSFKPKKTNYNMNNDMKKSVKSIKNDKKFIDKANEFLSTPVGKLVVGTAISGIIGIGMSVLKEQVLVDLKLKNKNKKNEYMSEDDYINKQRDVSNKRFKVNVDGKKVIKTQEDIEKGFKVYEQASDFKESLDAIKKKKKE